MLYHVTSVARLPYILRRGLKTFQPTLAQDYWRRSLGEEYNEEEFDCSTEAEHNLNEAIGRGECVYFWTDKDKAYETAGQVRKQLEMKPIILTVAPKKIPCKCYTNDEEIVSEIYDLFYDSCMNDIPVDNSRLDRLVDRYEKNVEEYKPSKKYPSNNEVWCPCDIPPTAIKNVEVYTGSRISKQYRKIKPPIKSEFVVTIE